MHKPHAGLVPQVRALFLDANLGSLTGVKML